MRLDLCVYQEEISTEGQLTTGIINRLPRKKMRETKTTRMKKVAQGFLMFPEKFQWNFFKKRYF